MSSSIDFDRKIDLATEGLLNHLKAKLLSIDEKQAWIIASYILSMKSEINLSDNYRKLVIIVLVDFLKFQNDKTFDSMTRTDILDYLDSYRKTEVKDPLHRWIGTYNLYRVVLIRFFRWFHYPDLEHKKRPKPACAENIPQLKRKEKSIYKPSDLWTIDDDLLFLRYCPSKRDRCYHMMARDTSCRPHEILKLRIKDVVFKMCGDRQYADGKTGQRHIPLINSVPYLKDWVEADHPQRGNPSAPFICGFSKSLGRFLKVTSMSDVYHNINSPMTGAGKNYLLSLVASKFPDKYVEQLVGASDKAFLKDSRTLSYAVFYRSSRFDGMYVKESWQSYNVGVHCVMNSIEVIFAAACEGLIIAVTFPELVRPDSLVTVTQKVTFVSPLTCGAMNHGDGVSAPFNETTRLPASLHEYFNADEFL